MPTQLAEESNALTVLPIRIFAHPDFLYVAPRVSVSRRTLQCRVRHFTPTYDTIKEFRKLYFVKLTRKIDHQVSPENAVFVTINST